MEYILTLRQVSDVANGLNYLHAYNVIHGDLKWVRRVPTQPLNLLHISQSSILVDGTGRARLADFGLAAIVLDSGPTAPIEDGHAVRWAAPEILDKQSPVSIKSDVYSFAMVVIAVRPKKVFNKLVYL